MDLQACKHAPARTQSMVVGSVKVTTLSRAQPRLRAVVCMTAVMKAIGLNVPLSHSDGGITVHTYTWICVCVYCVCVYCVWGGFCVRTNYFMSDDIHTEVRRPPPELISTGNHVGKPRV